MPTISDNHELELDYDPGDNWDYNDEMETIERSMAVRDLEANTASYTPYQDARFIATDTGATLDGTGDNWTLASREYDDVTVNSLSGVSTTPIENIEGSNLSVDSNGQLNASLEGSTGSYLTTDENAVITAEWTFEGTTTFDSSLTVMSDAKDQLVTDAGNTVLYVDGAQHELNVPAGGNLRVYDEDSAQYLVETSDGWRFPQGMRAAASNGSGVYLNHSDPKVEWQDDTEGAVARFYYHTTDQRMVFQDTVNTTEIFEYDPFATTPVLDFPNGAEMKGDTLVRSPDGEYTIEKDGTDGTGVINFKTS